MKNKIAYIKRAVERVSSSIDPLSSKVVKTDSTKPALPSVYPTEV
ncbi:MAG: hypothetical protein ACFBZ8_11225 [Opitutales bacterium]